MDPTLDYGALIQALFGGGPAAAQPMVPTGLQPPIQPPVPAPLMTTPAPVRPIEPYMTDPMAPPMPQIAQPAALGAMLEPAAPMPRPRPAEAPGGTYAAQAPGSPTPGDVKGMTDALKGVIAPPAPSSQKVGTPHPPAMGKISGGNVAELLASLGIGPQQAFPGLKLPSTLGQALGGR